MFQGNTLPFKYYFNILLSSNPVCHTKQVFLLLLIKYEAKYINNKHTVIVSLQLSNESFSLSVCSLKEILDIIKHNTLAHPNCNKYNYDIVKISLLFESSSRVNCYSAAVLVLLSAHFQSFTGILYAGSFLNLQAKHLLFRFFVRSLVVTLVI